MRCWLKRLLVLVFVAAAGGAVFSVVRRRGSASTTSSLAPQWPPFEPTATTATTAATTTTSADAEPIVHGVVESPVVEGLVDAPGVDWVLPIDDSCPDGFPIKANDNSHIFHVPGGRFYDRTVAERCYATAEAAERDGYRRAKA